MPANDDFKTKATQFGQTAQSAVSQAADKHSHKVTGFVKKFTDFLDEKSNGKTANISTSLNKAADSATTALKSSSTTASDVADDVADKAEDVADSVADATDTDK